MMTWIYLAIVALVLALSVRCCLAERDFWKQATAALVVVPLILRHLFGIPLGATVVPRLVAAAFTVPAYALLCRALLERTRLTPFLSLPPRG